MIIKSIYINQFGCLKGERLEFANGINVISLPNESGKSTIAEFIRVMLYGVNSLRFNQRKKYMPFGFTSMGGEMTVILDGMEYIIKRTFGTRKSDDTIEVINAVSGALVKEFSVDNIGGAMCGISGDTFENTCYIKQLSAKIDDVKSSEIQTKLINLIQNSDEEYSYRNAVVILDNAIKELNGPKGRINQTQAALNELAVNSAEKNKIKAEYESVKNKADNLKKIDTGEKANKLHLFSWAFTALSMLSIIFTGFNILTIMVFVLLFILSVILTFKNKKNNVELLENSKQIGFYESKLETLKEKYSAIDISQIDFYKEKLQSYNKKLADLRYAKEALSKAFEQLQMDYSPRLNKTSCDIFKSITDGKYTEFMVDEDYNITVRNNDNVIVSSDYLSSGTFDQIYFSLRMALISLICKGMPVILDDAFALYDDERMKKALNYLKTSENQVLVFSCQTREKNFMEGR